MICKICGKPESEHHEFIPEKIKPPGCKCDPQEWAGNIPPVCKEYAGDGVFYCFNCEHDKRCHE